MKIILASTSPRRRELLASMGISDFFTEAPQVDEQADDTLKPWAFAELLSARKAHAVAQKHPPSRVVIAADTVVFLEGILLGKPTDPSDAHAMLSRLSGKTHEVYTGVTVLLGNLCKTSHEKTSVQFRTLADAEIAAYLATGEPMDKAGAYAIQGLGGSFVQKIIGDFSNVVGLPTGLLAKMLRSVGVALPKKGL